MYSDRIGLVAENVSGPMVVRAIGWTWTATAHTRLTHAVISHHGLGRRDSRPGSPRLISGGAAGRAPARNSAATSTANAPV